MNKSPTPKLFNLPVLLLITVVLIGFLLLLFPWKSANFLSSQEPSNLKEQFSSRLLAEYHETLRTPDIANNEVLAFSSQLTKKGLWKQSGVLLKEKLDLPTLSTRQKKQLSNTAAQLPRCLLHSFGLW